MYVIELEFCLLEVGFVIMLVVIGFFMGEVEVFNGIYLNWIFLGDVGVLVGVIKFKVFIFIELV